MQVEKQFSVFLVNKPGVLAGVTRELGRAKINIVAMTLMDAMEHGVLRMVLSDPAEARKVLTRVNVSYTESDVLCISLSNRPGALADIAEALASAHININYAYVTAGAKGGRTTGVLKVADISKAVKVLQAKAKRKSTSREQLRRPPARQA